MEEGPELVRTTHAVLHLHKHEHQDQLGSGTKFLTDVLVQVLPTLRLDSSSYTGQALPSALP